MLKLPWLLLGGAAWTAGEYAIHRFVGHGPKRAPKEGILERLTPSGLAAEFNREHLAHHVDPSYFAPTYRKVMAAGVAVPLIGAVLTPVLGVPRALSFALGFATVYGGYEVVHRRIHTHGPTGPYSRWVRRHHLYHHHKTPRANHGVTSPLWDYVFDTEKPPGRVDVPRHVAPPWLVDAETGAVRAELAEDYALVGKGSSVKQAAVEAVPAT